MALDFPANPIVGQPSGTYEYTDPNGSITTYVWDGEKWTAKVDGGSKVTRIIAGANITVEPPEGTGVVTINSTGGGGGPTPPPNVTQTPFISSANGFTNEPITVDTRAIATNATFSNAVWLKDNVIIPGATSTSSYTPTTIGTYKFREIFNGDDLSVINADSNALVIGNPLQVGKGVITPNSGVEAGDSLTGSATVTNAVNPIETHVWEQDGTEAQRGTSATYTAKEGTIRYRKEVTDSNNATPVIGDWSDPVTVTAATSPSATMSGLRFDSNRANYLQRSQSAVDAFTYSAWCKPTSDKVFRFYNVDNGSQYNMLQYRGTERTLEMLSVGVTNPRVVSTQTFEHNTWHHFVFTWDGTTGTIYANGAKVAEGLLDYSLLNTERTVHIGRYFNGPQYSDGYLSDVYFVDGKVLEPTAFGEFIESKWAPLDNSKVKENIDAAERKQPYDDRANTSQVWSAVSSGTFYTSIDRGPEKAFDGTNAYAQAETGEASISSLGITDITSLRLRIGKNSGNDPWGVVKLDTTDITSWLQDNHPSFNNSPKWIDVTDQLSGTTLGSITIGTTGTTDARLAGVEVNGRLLVDQGVWNVDQDWSDSVTSSSGGFNPGNGPERLFDGDIGVGKGCDPNSSDPNTVTTFTCNIDYTDKVECLSTTNVGKCSWSVNNGAYQPMTTSGQWQEVASGTGTLTSIRCTNPNTGFPNWQAIRVDGALLIDAGAQWNTSQRWSGDLSASGSFNGSDPAVNAFDGSLTTKAGTTDTGGSAVITFTGPIAYTQSVRVYTYWGSAHNVTVSLNGGGGVTDPGNQWTTIATGSGTINTLTFTGTTNSAAVSAIEVDGKILVDAYAPGFGDNGFYLPFDPALGIEKDASGNDNHFYDENFETNDSVLDTPLRNYAVLEANRLKAKNGNLVAYHDGEGGAAVTTIPLELNGKYYFEAITKQDQNVGAGIQNNLGSIGNPAGGVPSGLYAIFGYLTDGYYRYNGGTRSVIPGTTLATGDVLGVAVDMTTKEVTFFVNGSQVDTFTMSNTDDSQGYRFCAITGNSPGAEVPVNFGQQPWIHTPPAGYEGLYQTWQEYARTTLGYALDRIAKLEQQRASDQQTINTLRVDVQTALARISSIEADEVSDDAVDTTLLSLVADLRERVEALEAE